MGYRFSLYKQIKMINGSEGTTDESFDPATGEYLTCVQVGKARYTYREEMCTDTYSPASWERFLDAMIIEGSDKKLTTPTPCTEYHTLEALAGALWREADLVVVFDVHLQWEATAENIRNRLDAIIAWFEPGDVVIFH
jgi:hypothetical protein